MPITNLKNIPLELAVWVIRNEYDYSPELNTISATGLMKPLRHIILPHRIPGGSRATLDVEDLIASALGNAIHAAIQRAWENGNHVTPLRELGYSEDVISRILVNPTPQQLKAVKDPIPVYVEQRASKTIKVGGIDITVSGKFDMVCMGRVKDTKSTTVFSWISGNKDDDHRMQMSLYRWLNPEKITEDHGNINYVFTDWAKRDARIRGGQGYPQNRLESKLIQLMSLEETERWVHDKISLILKYQSVPEDQIPECTDEELWMGPSTFKYYSNPVTAQQGGRSTRNFDGPEEANKFMLEKGKGVVNEVRGTPKRCGYCSAFSICTQKDQYNHD